MESGVHVAQEVAGIVRPGAFALDAVRVLAQDERLRQPLEAAAAAMRVATDLVDRTAAVRLMYKRVGIDPTKTRPSSEALLRRVRKGDELPRINTLVDIVNWCSLESQLPFGLYDRDRIEGGVTLRLGTAGEHYAGIRKDTVNVEGRLTLADDLGPFGNPTSDSARTMVTTATVRVLVVVFAPVAVTPAELDQVLAMTMRRVDEYGM